MFARETLVLVALALLGCNTEVWDFDAGASTRGGRDGGDAGGGGESDASVCTSLETRCGDTCANLQISARNCGGCNQACPGSQLCLNGQCAN